jgi:hypothetical protein
VSTAHDTMLEVERGRWLTPGVRGIGAASLLADVGHEVPTALLPSLLTSTLGAPASALGLIEGVSDGLAGAARLSGGALADDPRRRRAAAVGGYTTTAVLSGLIGEHVRGSAFGVLAGVQSLGNLAASAIAGLLYTVASPAAFAYTSALMAAALLVLVINGKR